MNAGFSPRGNADGLIGASLTPATLLCIEGYYTGLCRKSAIVLFRQAESAAIRIRFTNHAVEEFRFEIEKS
jgi:hypothetical protein